ncbi:rubrerythrin-like domain-containing protein [Halocatena halophila]
MPHDPAPSGSPYYECIDCGRREHQQPDGRLCSSCGGYLQNIGVPRQQ